jgi:hypothetical protein
MPAFDERSTHVATLKYVNHFGLGPLVPYDSGTRLAATNTV